jgi:ankyrin repeat protein
VAPDGSRCAFGFSSMRGAPGVLAKVASPSTLTQTATHQGPAGQQSTPTPYAVGDAGGVVAAKRTTRDVREQALREACARGLNGTVRRMLAENASGANALDPECGRKNATGARTKNPRSSPLILAAQAGSRATIEVLVARGAELRQIDAGARSALHWAAKRGHYELAIWLLKSGLNPRATDAQGRTPLMLAAWWGHTKLVKLLLTGPAGSREHAAERDKVRGWSALAGACHFGRAQAVTLLIKAGHDPQLADRWGRPPLLMARCAPVVELLLSAGAAAEAQCPATGRTALHWAAAAGDTDIVRLLVEDVRRRRKDLDLLRRLLAQTDSLTGCSPLQLAARAGHAAALSELRAGLFDAYQFAESKRVLPRRPASGAPDKKARAVAPAERIEA